MNQTLLANHSTMLDLLEIPQLMDTSTAETAEVTRRLSNATKEATNRSTGLQSHEDLAKKLQDKMERNRRSSLGSKSDGSGRRMREVACPTCTVHLQVQVPSSGSETIVWRLSAPFPCERSLTQP